MSGSQKCNKSRISKCTLLLARNAVTRHLNFVLFLITLLWPEMRDKFKKMQFISQAESLIFRFLGVIFPLVTPKLTCSLVRFTSDFRFFLADNFSSADLSNGKWTGFRIHRLSGEIRAGLSCVPTLIQFSLTSKLIFLEPGKNSKLERLR